MKICFCIGKLTFSGAENVIRYLSESLIKRGYEVSVVLTEELPREQDRIEGLTVEGAIIREGGFVNALRRIKAIRTALKKLNPDIFVIFNYTMAFTAVPAAKLCKGMKIAVCERNDPTSVPKSSKRKLARDFLFRFGDVCVSQTNTIADYFKKIVKKNVVIPNPIREPGIMCPDVAKRKKVFATVARLDDYQKNQSMLIRAFALVLQKHPDYELHFLGCGPDQGKYTALIKELGVDTRVKLLGNVKKPLEYIRNCRGFLLSSNYEGMPNALIEAMSIGLPCISTDCLGGGAAALIKEGENGFLIERGNEQLFAERITSLIEDDALCQQMGKNAYKINDTLAGDRIVTMWEEMIKDVLSMEKEDISS